MDMMADGGGAKTLYVGNLHPSVTEDLILALFGQIGAVKGCKIIRESGGQDPYCFVEFANHQAASAALIAMNRRRCLEKEMKVNWASNPSGSTAAAPGGKVDTSLHHHIFIGDLSPEVDTDTLRNAFAPFGEISDCRVVRDMATNKSRGYGFCSFLNKEDAQAAIDQMNGQWLGTRSIRTNWATRKPSAPGGNSSSHNGSEGGSKGKLNYEEVYQRSSSENFTVYCGGLLDCDENGLRRIFSSFGRIMETRHFKDKGYAFVRFDNKASACSAIVGVHGLEYGGQTLKCSWGKENSAGGGAHQGQMGGSMAMENGHNPSSASPFGNPYNWEAQMQSSAGPQQPYFSAQQQYYAYMYSPQYM